MKNRVFFAAVAELLADLPKRSQEIVKKRFGLAQEKPETLEKIGGDYDITRERVRQIVTDATKKMAQKKSDPLFLAAKDAIVCAIKVNSGIIRESELIKQLGLTDWKEANAMVFMQVCLAELLVVENQDIARSWALETEAVKKATAVSLVAKEILQAEKEILAEKDLVAKIDEKKKGFSKEEILNYLRVTNGAEKNQFGKWGLSEWKEVNPKGTRERIYSVLKEKKKPLHFSEIAKLIDEYKLGKKKAHIQTVHNELIKHDQFVLIGRGVYALREWGYAEGTIKDVLQSILKQKALSREEVLAEVAKVRQVKKATILINLSNSKLFVRENGTYRAR